VSPDFSPHRIPGEGLKSKLWAPLAAMAHMQLLSASLRGDQVSPRYHIGMSLGHPSVSQNWEVFLEQMELLIFRSAGLRNALQIDLLESMQLAARSRGSCQV